MQPAETETVKVNIPAGRLGIVAVAPDPPMVIPPGLIVTVQSVSEGKPLNSTLPVDTVQVG